MAHVGKTTLSQHLRTMCEKQLFLSLFSQAELKGQGLPAAVKARPALEIFKREGREWEQDRYSAIEAAFPGQTLATVDAKGKITRQPLKPLLSETLIDNTFILEGEFGDEELGKIVLTNLGLTEAEATAAPKFQSFRPDIIQLRAACECLYEVTPQGTLKPISSTETRQGLRIVDVKNVGEGNTSYGAEVVMYSLVMSAWLDMEGLRGKYFVDSEAALLVRSSEGSYLTALLQKDPGASIPWKLDALAKDMELVPALQFLPSVVTFLAETLPRVAAVTDISKLEWHVDSRCAVCDWLGYEGWLSLDQQKEVASNEHYCFPRAKQSGHLSRVPFISRGARRSLEQSAVGNVQALASLPSNAPAFKTHNALMADARFLPRRAASLSGVVDVDASLQRGDLPRFANLQIFISINFDAAKGLVTGIGIYGLLNALEVVGQPMKRKNLPKRQAYVMVDPTFAEEEQNLLAFLGELGRLIEIAADTALDKGGPEASKNKTQIYIWDRRQYEELCKAIGRHLGAIMGSPAIKGLAWIFPPEEMLQNPEHATTPPIAIIKPVLRKSVAIPSPHTYTLFGVIEHYHLHAPGGLPSYYFRDPLSDMIPRERIYEVWERTTKPRFWQDILAEYRSTILAQVSALAGITWRLNNDLETIGVAPVLNLNGLPNLTLNDDSRLWAIWSRLEDELISADSRLEYLGDPQEQEASYSCIRLNKFIGKDAKGDLIFEAADDSVHSKIDDSDSFLALRCESIPGFLTLRVSRICEIGSDFPGDEWKAKGVSLDKVFGAKLVTFDRVSKRVTVQLSNFSNYPQIRNYIEAKGALNYQAMKFSLMRGSPLKGAPKVEKVLRLIGNPPIAIPHPSALVAYGAQTAKKPGKSAITPVADVLWNAPKLATAPSSFKSAGITAATSGELANALKLNPAQKEALLEALSKRLSVIWGPPGTGKTKVVAATISTLLDLASSEQRNLRILISGPTYKALQEIKDRVFPFLEEFIGAPLTVYFLYSASRDPEALPKPINPHLNYVNTAPNLNMPEFQQMIDELGNPTRMSITFALPQQCFNLADKGLGIPLAEVFDVCIIDECSQVEVTSALFPLSLLAKNSQAILFGDHLQMPPIWAAAPPVGAEFMVGSIQTYMVERFKGQVNPKDLIINYRSSSPFVEFAKTLSYPKNLQSHSPNLKIALKDGWNNQPKRWPLPLAFGPWIECAINPNKALVTLLHEDGKSGQFNAFEAALVSGLVSVFYENMCQSLAGEIDSDGNVIPTSEEGYSPENFWKKGVGIVTAHSAQRVAVVSILKALFPSSEWEWIEKAVDTVEKFQGGQRDAIIISFGVGDPDLVSDEEGFLLQLERTNVAVSRARAKCIVIMSKELAHHLPEDKEVLETSRAIKSFVFEACNNRTRVDISFEGNNRLVELRSNI